MKLSKPMGMIGFTIITHCGSVNINQGWVQGHVLKPLVGSRDFTFTGGYGGTSTGSFRYLANINLKVVAI